MANRFDKQALLEDLEPIRYEKEKDKDADDVGQMSLATALLTLAEIDHERVYEMCRVLAEHVLGTVPEPDDIDAGGGDEK